MKRHFSFSGFTLIEVMVAAAILAVLAVIAYPSYQRHVKNARMKQASADSSQTLLAQNSEWTTKLIGMGSTLTLIPSFIPLLHENTVQLSFTSPRNLRHK